MARTDMNLLKLIIGTKTARKLHIGWHSFFTKAFFLYPDAYGLNLCPLCLLSTWGPGYHRLSTCIDYLNFQPKSSTISKNLAQKYQKLFDFILKATTALHCVSQSTGNIYYSRPMSVIRLSGKHFWEGNVLLSARNKLKCQLQCG